MSTHKKQKTTITKLLILNRLRRLPIVQRLSVPEFVAFVALLLVHKGKPIELEYGIRVIHRFKLHHKLECNSAIPTVNALEALIHIVVYKRKVLNHYFEHKEYPIWEDEIAAPIFDILEQLSKIYLI